MKNLIRGLLLASFLSQAPAYAHKFSTAYMEVSLHQSQPLLVWKVALHDLAQAGLVETDGSNALSWQQVLHSQHRLQQYIKQRIGFSSKAGSCELSSDPDSWQVQRMQHNMFLVLPLRVQCANTERWQLSYQALFDNKHNHKLLLSWQLASTQAEAVLSEQQATYPVFDLP